MVQAYSTSTKEVQAGRLQIQGQPGDYLTNKQTNKQQQKKLYRKPLPAPGKLKTGPIRSTWILKWALRHLMHAKVPVWRVPFSELQNLHVFKSKHASNQPYDF
jgi:hypothetical protein